MICDEIIMLWRTELSAVETYAQALGERQWNDLKGAHADRLINILADHVDAAAQLQAQIKKTETTPVNGLGLYGSWFKWGAGSAYPLSDATLFSDEAAILVLKEAEEHTLKNYNDILDDRPRPIRIRSLIQSLIVKQQSHIWALDQILRTAEQSAAEKIRFSAGRERIGIS